MNIRSLGVKGDGKTDDTAAIQHAIDTTQVLYIPSGRYMVHDTIRLKPDTVLIGLHPSITQFDLPDNTPGFAGVGAPKALLETPQRRRQYRVRASGFSPAASIRARWRPCGSRAQHSLMDDVRFLGGHGTNNPDGSRWDPYNATHSADPDMQQALGRAISLALGDQWRRRHLRQSVDGGHLCPVRHHRLGHQDAGPCL